MNEAEKFTDELVAHERHVRVEELIHALTKPTFRWRMANGVVTFRPNLGDAEVPKQHLALRQSGLTRRTNAERDFEAAVKSWYQKHFEDE